MIPLVSLDVPSTAKKNDQFGRKSAGLKRDAHQLPSSL